MWVEKQWLYDILEQLVDSEILLQYFHETELDKDALGLHQIHVL